uniref:Uncharacterized protein n=1 Tax=Romanomermis culicivorax TaxID=13658 RepID=A0A915JKK7_ROMCU
MLDGLIYSKIEQCPHGQCEILRVQIGVHYQAKLSVYAGRVQNASGAHPECEKHNIPTIKLTGETSARDVMNQLRACSCCVRRCLPCMLGELSRSKFARRAEVL